MKDDIDGIPHKAEGKLSRKSVFCASLLVCCLLVLILGILAGTRVGGNAGYLPVYHRLTRTNDSCPPLTGEMLTTTVGEGQSFEGLVVLLECRTGYSPFPSSVRCERRRHYDGSAWLQWSNYPLCYPGMDSVMTSTKYARSVYCTGSPGFTQCKLHCDNNYVAVEESSYSCSSLPCPAWRADEKRCYVCSNTCQQFHALHHPLPGDLLRTLTCDHHCDKIVLTSDSQAAIWQSKRTGLFEFVGEHNGRPAYQNMASKEYLYYTTSGAEWLVGPNFKKKKAGIQIFKNDDKDCPERHGGANSTSLYMDSSKPGPGSRGLWRNDTTIRVSCYSPSTPVKSCTCPQYKVYHTVYQNTSVPKQVEYLSGYYKKVENSVEKYGILAPVYREETKNLFLFSFHPEGKVWQISQKMTTTPIRGVFSSPACPDSENITWELYNKTTRRGKQKFIKDPNIQVKCLKTGWEA